MANQDVTMQEVRAREALRQVELRLAAQATALVALEARAGWVVNWSLAGLAAGAAAVTAASTRGDLDIAAWVVIAAAVVSGALALWALRPGPFGVPGHAVADCLHGYDGADVPNLLTWLAEGSAEVAAQNTARLTLFSRNLRLALYVLGAGPLLAIAAIVIF